MPAMLRDVKAMHEPSSEEVAQVLVQLLKRARHALDKDALAARREINRALELLSHAPYPTEVQQDHARQAQQGLAPWQARRVLHHIHANLETPIRVEDMASLTRLSTSYFFRAFKRCFGISPHAFVVNLRLARASELLTKGDDHIAAIATACGFSDQAHFSRVFRREMGCAPGVWRRAQLGVSAPAASLTSALAEHCGHELALQS